MRRLLRVLALSAGIALAGCASTAADDVDSAWRPGYLWQSVRGHLGMLAAARPVDAVMADPATAPALRERLALSREMRDYAVRALALPDNASYRRYADLGRTAAVWMPNISPIFGSRSTGSKSIAFMKKIHTKTVSASGETNLRDSALWMMPFACSDTMSTRISTAAWKRPGTPEVALRAASHSTKTVARPSTME